MKLDFKSLTKSLRKTVKKTNHKRKVNKDTRNRKKAEYLATLPKGRVKRTLYRLHPRRVAKYWFSRQGAIMALKITGLGLAAFGLLVFGLFAYYRKDLPSNFADLQACVQGQTTEYYDRTGETLLWASKGNIECTPVALDQINPYLINAVIATEDKDFYDHGGFKISSVLRAAISNVTGGGRSQGGSTITQQYVKNAVLKNNEKVYSRKIKELILAIELERSFTKDEILNAYLNVASFGSVYDGIEAASRGYFDKSANDLTLDEAALLTAAIPSPTFYWNSPEAHVGRQHYILGLMRDQGKISQEEYDQALAVDTLAKVKTNRNQYEGIIAPHFVLEVEKRLIEEYGEGVRKLGLKVITTLDLEAQRYVEEAITNNMYLVDAQGLDNAASTVVDVATGKVVAMLGSRGFDHPGFGQNNYATVQLDPGSSFKAYVFSALFANTNDWGAGSTIYDYRTEFQPGWTPKSWDNGEYGPISVRYALGQSRNPPAIKAMYIAGIDKTIELASALGVRTPPPCGDTCYLSSAIGSGVELRMDEHTNAYASLSRMGEYKPLTYIDTIYDANGDVISEWTDQGEQVLDPQVAYIINDMLADDSVRIISNGYYAVPGVYAAMKTGTTNNFKNNWIMGYSKTYSVAVWIGHHDNARSFTNISTNRPKTAIYKDIMSKLHANLPENAKDAWARPEGIKTVRIDRNSGYQSDSGQADIFPSWYVPKRRDTTQTVQIDKVSGKRATACTPARAIETVNGGSILAELPESDPYYQKWMAPIIAKLGTVVGGAVPSEDDDLHSCDDVKPSISFESVPGTCDGSCTFKVRVTEGTHNLSTVNFKVNDQILAGGSLPVSSTGTVTFNYTVNIEGPQTLTAEVVDSALYDSSVSATVEFIKNEPVIFDSVGVQIGGPGNSRVYAYWTKPSSDLSIDFGGDCSGSRTLGGGTQDNFPRTSGGLNIPDGGSCTATLRENGSPTDTVSFNVPS